MTNKNTSNLFSISRQLFQSDIWLKKPATWNKIWIYIIGRVNHTDSKMYKRGEGFFQFPRELSEIGRDITIDTVKKCLTYLRRKSIISTTRSTRGVTIKVLNYNKLQSQSKISGTTTSTREALEKHEESTTVCNNVNNVNKRTYMQKWMDYRKSIKKPVTNQATLEALVKRFNSESLDKIEQAVTLSIENNYQGLFWDKDFKQSINRGTRRQSVNLTEEEKEQYR